jgi:purine-binding chemotaxis protein CheW
MNFVKAPSSIVLFTLDEPRYALDLSAVKRVVRAVEITPLPKAPEIVLGVINLQGQVVPVVDARKRFRLPGREMDLHDRFIIASTSRRLVALVADSVVGIRELGTREMVSAEQALPFASYIQGVAKVEGDLVLIYDLDQFLSLDEEQMLDAALSEAKDEE